MAITNSKVLVINDVNWLMSQLQSYPWSEDDMTKLVPPNMLQRIKADSFNFYDMLKDVVYYHISSRWSVTMEEFNVVLQGIHYSLSCSYKKWADVLQPVQERKHDSMQLSITDVGMLSNQMQIVYCYWNNLATELDVPVAAVKDLRDLSIKCGCREAFESLLEMCIETNWVTLIDLRLAVCRTNHIILWNHAEVRVPPPCLEESSLGPRS